MRTWITTLALLASLLLVAGCGGEEGEAPSETPVETTPTTTAPATAPSAEPEVARTPTLSIINSGGERVEVEIEIADETAEQTQGLSERTELAEDAGMLFVFNQERTVSFQMRDTLIPLSIAFIDAEGVIVDIQDMQPLTEGPYVPAAPAQYALEVNQGFFANRSIEVGNVVELPGRPGSVGTPSSAQVVQAFQGADLEVGETYPVEQEQGWQEKPIPKTYTEATRFRISSLQGDAGGRVFVFASEPDLTAVRDYYEGLEASLRPHLYVEGQVLLQITNLLPREEADRYGAVLRETV